MLPRLAAAAVLTLATATASGQAGPSASVAEPRAFGYTVGDVFQRHVTLTVPPGMVLDLDSLPRTHVPGQALELRSAQWLRSDELVLEYQVFLSPPAVRTLEVPPMKLKFNGPAGEHFLRIDAWPVTVSPLVPVEVSPRDGLGEMQPDAAAPLIDTTSTRHRLFAYAGLGGLALGYLGGFYFGLPWWGRRTRPFAQVWREMRRASADPAADPRRTAFARLHGALNASAGEVLFESGLDRFIAAQPTFAPLQEDLVEFFRRSRDEFFAGRHGDLDHDLPWLRQLCRRCRDAERGCR